MIFLHANVNTRDAEKHIAYIIERRRLLNNNSHIKEALESKERVCYV